MLYELDITDFAIIERTSICFSSGLNALTGETGAGKSILLDALGAVLGARVSSDLVRTGARAARVEAVFGVDGSHRQAIADQLDQLGIAFGEDDDLILTREIQATGRSSARVNGRPATSSQLSEIGSVLVDIHGQSDHLAILKTATQRQMLDRFAGAEDAARQVGALYSEYSALQGRIRALTSSSREQEQRVDLLRFQVDEIAEVGLNAGEDERLILERTVLQNADRLRLDAETAINTLIGDEVVEETPSAIVLLRKVETTIADLAQVDQGAQGFNERVTDLVVLADDLSRDLRGYLETLEADPERLAGIEDRLALIQSLKRKYGQTIEEILVYAEEAQSELERLTGSEFDLESLMGELEAVSAKLGKAVTELSVVREQAANVLGERIEAAIADLRMGNATVEIAVRQHPDLNGIEVNAPNRTGTFRIDAHGMDEIEYLIAPNSGEAPKPLGRIASGGETARLMLALKSILSEVDTTPTLVFDEIDVGVGGRSGQVVGEKLASLAGNHQVIVVTHLPQIAAFAETHLRIAKNEIDARTISVVEELDDGERVRELAAMIDGLPLTEAALSAANQMLDRSQTASHR